MTTRTVAASSVVAAAHHGDVVRLTALLAAGAPADARDPRTGLTALMIAAGRGEPASVRVLLRAGADPRATEPGCGASVLHKACQGGDVEVVRQLLAAGAFVDAVTPTSGHTPLLDALWFGFPDVVECLLDAGAGTGLYTHYGVSLLEHFHYELAVNPIGRDRLLRAEELLARRAERDVVAVTEQVLMLATTAGDVAGVRAALAEGAAVDERAPRRNGFNDGHTALIVAARDGSTEIVRALLDAGADANAAAPLFGATALHKAAGNGHADTVRELVRQPGIDLDARTAADGYTPLHAALRRGHDVCARLVVEAGAALDATGHDDRTPLDLAVEVFGQCHEVTDLVRPRRDLPAA